MTDLNSLMEQMNNEMASAEAFQPKQTKTFERDERIFRIGKDQDGNGSAKIRFIPSYNTEKNKLNTFITKLEHSIEQYSPYTKADGKKDKRFIKKVCPRTIDSKAECPICDHGWDNYKDLKAEGNEAEAKKFLKFVNKERYLTNIQVIEDKNNPENNGKIFVLEYGNQLKEIIQKEMQPSDEDIEERGMQPFNAWDMVKGRYFRLKLTDGKFTSNGFPSWTESFFSKESEAHVNGVDEMKEILEKAHVLDEYIAEDKIESTEELQSALEYVTFQNGDKTKTDKKEDAQSLSSMKTMDDEPKPEPKKENSPKKEEQKQESGVMDSIDDFLADFE